MIGGTIYSNPYTAEQIKNIALKTSQCESINLTCETVYKTLSETIEVGTVGGSYVTVHSTMSGTLSVYFSGEISGDDSSAGLAFIWLNSTSGKKISFNKERKYTNYYLGTVTNGTVILKARGHMICLPGSAYIYGAKIIFVPS